LYKKLVEPQEIQLEVQKHVAFARQNMLHKYVDFAWQHQSQFGTLTVRISSEEERNTYV